MKPASTSFAHLGWSLAGGLFVSAVILSLVTAVTLAVPKTYMSTTRVLLRSIQPPGTSDAVPVDSSALHTELATIESSLVLRKAAERVNLAARWTPIYLGTGHNQAGLQPAEIVAILKDHVEVRQVRNTPVAEIRVYNTDRQLAADLANAIAQSYLESRLEGPAADRWRPSLIDLAEPGLRPVRPNVPLNVFVGLLTGGALGAVTAGGLWWLLRRRSRSRAMAVAPTT